MFLIVYIIIIIICFFLGLHPKHLEVPRLDVESELWPLPAPQPQQCQIRVASLTYTTAHGNNAGSLTH